MEGLYLGHVEVAIASPPYHRASIVIQIIGGTNSMVSQLSQRR